VGRAPSLRVLPWHFALQLRKKHGKTWVAIGEIRNTSKDAGKELFVNQNLN